ncbi:hypothetical protein TetV_030 [Tetraselmis virus 1]|uniref:Uncharacterized protein n=1 Tax=Tetraselmis virus 1 TaxID=2060617 RepID=A0A2P0VML2_9VIRU|nr:hypothetical protein QJ968_gp030 [Tetraselmis virus 1]AUF82122.1 hypothetical protein TetV_030 [Tetraselmis virus 1]
MDHGIIKITPNPDITFRNDIFESCSNGSFGPHIVMPVQNILLRNHSTRQEFFEFMIALPPIHLPIGCHIVVSNFLSSIGCGERDIILACRYRSAVDAILREGLDYLKLAHQTGWCFNKFFSDPIFPGVFHPSIVSAICKKCVEDIVDTEDIDFLKTYFFGNFVLLQPAILESQCPDSVKIEFLKNIEPVTMVSATADFMSLYILRYGASLDALYPHTRLILCSAIEKLSDNDPLCENIYQKALHVDVYTLDLLIQSCMKTNNIPLCKKLVVRRREITQDDQFYHSDVAMLIHFINRTEELENIVIQLLTENMCRH